MPRISPAAFLLMFLAGCTNYGGHITARAPLDLDVPWEDYTQVEVACRNGGIELFPDNNLTDIRITGEKYARGHSVVEAEGQDIVIDLMKAPAIQRDAMLRAAFAAASSYLCVTGIQIADDEIQLKLGLLPGGPKEAALSTARAALTPIVRYLWPEGRP